MTPAAAPSQPQRKRGRPPKDQTAVDATRTHLVRAGVAILTEKGFSAVGLDEILSSVGIPKGSFYYYFDSKTAFGLTLVDAYADFFARKLDRWFEQETRPPLQRLRDFVADAREGMRRHEFRRGCLVGNLGQEMGALPEVFRDRLASVFRDWEARTAKCLRAAQAAGEIADNLDCDRLASFFWIGWEGAVLRAKLERSPVALDEFADGYFKLLETPVQSRRM
ncbi:MAG: TetR family transcriptional regulator [Xanthobacteraceae bacterium]|nr:MAG: TetR family transcriptional regulator [Xanthobacteraceae bacterium]